MPPPDSPFRLIALVVLLGTLGTSAHFRYRARMTGGHIPRRAEGIRFAALRALVALPLFLGPLLYVANPNWMRWSSLELPAWLRWSGVVLGLLTIPGAQWVFRSIGRNVSETVLTKERHELVTAGPYRWIRHPLYAVGILLFVSIGLIAANWFILGLAALAALFIRFLVIPIEEHELSQKFGDHYGQYIARTGRLFPRVTRIP
jgi:protein-S-isoprenylcysteine O-methyltransferase Ste14